MKIGNASSVFLTSDGIRNLAPREALEWCEEGAILLDVRNEYISQFKKFGVPVTLQIPYLQMESEWPRLPKDKWIIVADSSGLHSKEACILLEQKGFTQIVNLAGGLIECERDAMPLQTDNRERLSGSCACQLRARERKDSAKK